MRRTDLQIRLANIENISEMHTKTQAVTGPAHRNFHEANCP